MESRLNEEQKIGQGLPTLSGPDLANLVLHKVGAMPHLKLQKLLFYADAWHSVFFDVPLVREEFEAWVHGPVLRSVWDQYREVSVLSQNIPVDRIDSVRAEQSQSRLNADQLEFLQDLLGEYGPHTAYHLERLTHSERPWLEARGSTPAFQASSAPISKTATREFYASRLDA